ncbi:MULTISPECIES: hypothetical protein [Streptomyces]|uniref:Zinc-finger domain-containing protein n=2 Tax=Streptomyces TaxID=1883 RepID=A0A100Y3N6_9ACTN|nr:MULTISPECIES: hypothetical protein [Streptomyces]KUH37091.1 hypothetical protein ATE80_20045 [Streptomyces kanasensis]UUS31978.1 hypothetical protein NRO40_14895 [Streptomyces changanensis]
MTSTADTTQHPDVSEISDLTEGVLPPARTAHVRRHLDRCELCADVRDSLEEIRGMLGTLPGPARMPVDIAERIDAALAAEALLDATSPDGAPAAARETVSSGASPDGDAERHGDAVRGPRPKPAERPATPPHGSTGPGRKPPRRRRRHAVLSAVCGLAAVGLGVLLFQAVGPTDETPNATRADSAVSQGSDPRFSGTALSERVRSLLAAPERFRSGPSPRAQQDDGPDPMIAGSATPLPPCVRQGLDRAEQPLAAELGAYRGRPAYLVLLPTAGAEQRVDVYIVDASCATDRSASGAADVLLKESRPRP